MSLLIEFFLIEYAILLLLGIIFGVGSSFAWFRMGGKTVKKLLLTTSVSERDRIRLQLRDEDGELLLQSPAGFKNVDELKRRAGEIAQRVIVINENAEGLKG